MTAAGSPRSSEDGYASLTAIVLCAAISVLCAGAISLAWSMKKAESHKLAQVQRSEAMNTAVLKFARDIVLSEQPYRLVAKKRIETAAGPIDVRLRGEAEYAKWPITAIDRISPAALAHATRLGREDLKSLATGRPNDCARRLVSSLGSADIEKDRPTFTQVSNITRAKDGQVWRIRAVSGNAVEERRVRFLGDPDHLFALISIERLSLGEMPECTDLTEKP